MGFYPKKGLNIRLEGIFLIPIFFFSFDCRFVEHPLVSNTLFLANSGPQNVDI